jgi:crotonobetainyl-CoA:carnitine CoA-transferase CaiB-like acyl-CoA transferase
VSEGEGLPLEGITVVELGSSVAAPYAAWILAALGARVLKVERPGAGDDARHWGPPFWQATATLFHALNRDKRSLAIDLKDPAQQARLVRLLEAEADVLIQNFRPGVAARLGLDAERLMAANPRLIYCSIRAFGASGPLRERPGYDPLMQAFGGIMDVTGEEGREPVRAGTSVVDMGTGMWCAIGILAMLQRRAASGRGGVVDASLLETALAWMSYHAAGVQATGERPVRRGSGIQGLAPYQAYRCEDGWLMVAAPNDGLFARLAAALGHPEWPADPRFASNPERCRNLAALNALMAPILAARTRSAWQEALDAAGVPSAPVQGIDEALAHPQTAALGIVQQVAGSLPLIGLPLSFDGHRPPLRNPAPALGEDDEALGPDHASR